MKTCATCKQAKHESEFGKQKSKRDGLCCYCKPCYNALQRTWRAENKDKADAIITRHRAKPESKEQAKLYARGLRKDPLNRYKNNLSRRLRTALSRKSLGSKSKGLSEIIGCSPDFLFSHLVLSAVGRYGYWLDAEAYHIDHIIPLATAETADDINRLNHYSNLQLLTPKDNQVKGCNSL